MRALARTPAFTVTTVASLGVGVGLATSVFAVAHAQYLAPLPYDEPDGLVELWQTREPGSQRPIDYLQPERMLGWIGGEMRTLRGLAGRGLGSPLVLEREEGPERVDVEPVAGDWFGVLGARPSRGRVLTLDDARPLAEPAAVVSHAFWRDRTGSDPGIVGRVLRLSGTAVTVVGVMPPSFDAGAKLWLPVESLPAGARPVAYAGVARLADGAGPADAAREIERLSAGQVAADSGRWGGMGATAVPIGAQSRGGQRPTLWLLAGVVAAVLLVGMTNLTTLFLVRAQERSPGMAVRASLGAGAWQLGRGLATEALLVGLAGSLLGLLLAAWGKDAARAMLAGEYGFTGEPVIGVQAAGVALGLGVLVTVVVGLEPLRRLRTLDVRDLLQRRAGGASGTPGERRTRNALVAAQVAVSVMLVALAGVLGSAYRAFGAIDVGYDAESLIEAYPDYALAAMAPSGQWAVARQVAERVRGRPGVDGVTVWRGVMQSYPPQPGTDAAMEGPPRELSPFQKLGRYYEVEPGFFSAVGLELVRGRGFTERDGPAAPYVAVVTRGGAEAWWPGEDPLGRRIRLGSDGVSMTVVGVAEDAALMGNVGRAFLVGGRHLPLLYRPARQARSIPEGWRAHNCVSCEGPVVAVRAAGATAGAAEALREAFASVAPALPLRHVGSAYGRQMTTFSGRRLMITGRLLAAGSLAAALLALLGIAGVVADGVVRRRREIGLRVALGARSRHVLRTVVREGVLTTLAGLGAGLVALALLHDPLESVVYSYDVRRLAPGGLEPGLLALAAAAVLAVSLAAALVTARRALRVDPAVALRSE